MPHSLAQRRASLIAALGFMRLRWREPAPPVWVTFSRWMNSWTGLGAVVVGMHAQDYDVQLQQYPEAWRATFYTIGVAHSIFHASAYERTPWRATQRAAWETLNAPEAAAEP